MRTRPRFFLIFVLLGLLTASCASKPFHPALQTANLPGLIPLRTFYQSEHRSFKVKISPDGQRLAWIGYEDGRAYIFITTVGKDGRQVIDTRSRGLVHQYSWLQDSHRLLFTADHKGDENYRLFLVDINNPNQQPVDLSFRKKMKAEIQQVLRAEPNQVLVTYTKAGNRPYGLFRLDVNTRAHTLVAQNDGLVYGWITDDKGNLRARKKKLPDKKVGLEQYSSDLKKWLPITSWRIGDIVRFLSFTPDDTGMWVMSNRNRDKISLVRLDLKTGEESIYFEDPAVDLDMVIISRLTRQPILAMSFPDYPKIHYFDSKFKDDLHIFHQNQPMGLFIKSSDYQEKLWTLSVYTDKGEDYYIYNRETGKKYFLHDRPISLYSDKLSHVKPIAFKSRDGLAIHGYLTLARGTSGKKLPMVLLVHGGPWSRDYWGYDSLVQFLANRGYAVLQINFRGSIGYGRTFLESAVGEFAGKMHTDLLDGVQWAIEQGVADPRHIAIVGGSYGGYAALIGLTFTPDAFACGIDIAGPSNLVSLLNEAPERWGPLWHKFVGNPQDPYEKQEMEAKSPLFRVDQIVRPLLVFHGANDARVKPQESEQMVGAMQKAGKQVEFFLFPDEGHHLLHWDSVSVLYKEIEKFLAVHLGGRRARFQ